MTNKYDQKQAGLRLSAAREKLFSSAAAAADHLDVEPGTYRAHESGRAAISAASAENYADLFDVEPGWILFGKGRGVTAGHDYQSATMLARILMIIDIFEENSKKRLEPNHRAALVFALAETLSEEDPAGTASESAIQNAALSATPRLIKLIKMAANI